MKKIKCLDCGIIFTRPEKKTGKRIYCDICRHKRILVSRRKTSEKWRQEYPEEAKKRHRKQYEKLKNNPVRWIKLKEKNKQFIRDERKKAIKIYGGKCKCCGETRYEFLAFDHINNDGYKHRKKLSGGGAFYRWLKKNNYPNSIQILCHNCNMAKGFWGYCPHTKIKSQGNDYTANDILQKFG